MVRIYLFALLIPFLALFSCTSPPTPPPPAPAPKAAPAQPKPAPSPPKVEVFNPESITQEVKEATLFDIQQFVQDLNKIVKARNYDQWASHLSSAYLARISSKEFLEDLTAKFPAFRGRINNAREYFMNVVVPSHANDHVDNIDFINSTTVRAYTVDAKGQTAILYNLEHNDGIWKISD